jgi:hypothetical protein
MQLIPHRFYLATGVSGGVYAYASKGKQTSWKAKNTKKKKQFGTVAYLTLTGRVETGETQSCGLAIATEETAKKQT